MLIETLAVGTLVGLLPGVLGGGGVLTVPIPVYLLGEPPGTRAPASLVIVGIEALVGATTRALLLAFAALIVVVAVAMLANSRGRTPADGEMLRRPPTGSGGGTAVDVRPDRTASLLVIAVTSAASIASRVGIGEFGWSVIAPFTPAAVGATMAGKRMTDPLSGDTLTRAFAVLLVPVAGFVTLTPLPPLPPDPAGDVAVLSGQ